MGARPREVIPPGAIIGRFAADGMPVPVEIPMPIDWTTHAPLVRPLPSQEKHAVYVTRNLLAAVTTQHPADLLPEKLNVLFPDVEPGTGVREAYRLTPEMWDSLRDKAVEMILARQPDEATARLVDQRLEHVWQVGRRYGAILEGQR